MSRSASRRARAAQEKAKRRLQREPVVLEFEYDPGALQYHGPILVTDLTVTDAHRQALEQAGQPVPAKVRCRFLVDTGADTSVVKHEFAERAGLKLINDNAPLHGVGVDTTGRVYMGRIVFGVLSRVVPGGRHEMGIETQVMAAKLETTVIDGLIGRDVLRHFALSYDGKTGIVRMKYHKPEP